MKLTEDYVLFTDDSIDVNFLFKMKEMERFMELWNDGESLQDIAKEIKRKPFEIALLIIDLDLRGLIMPRKKGIFGGQIIKNKKCKHINK